MFTPMQWKRIIHGLVQCVVGMVTEMVQRRVITIDGSHHQGLGTFTVMWNVPTNNDIKLHLNFPVMTC